MKKILLICLPILLLSISLSGQTKEGLLVIGLDTFAVVKVDRIDSANVTKSRLDSTIQQVIELNAIINELEVLVEVQDSVLTLCEDKDRLFTYKETLYKQEVSGLSKDLRIKSTLLEFSKFLIPAVSAVSFYLGYTFTK